MPSHAEQRPSPYTAQQLYALVDDVKSYPQFLPWCLGARVRRVDAKTVHADLILGWQAIRESFTTKNTSDPEALTVSSELIKGPFSKLDSRWKLIPQEQGCIIDFSVDFAFKSRILATVVEPLFMTAQRKLIQAFEARADALYARVKAA